MKTLEELKTQKDWKEYLQSLLRTNDEALKKAIVKVYENQTLGEQWEQKSLDNNSIGFNRVDAKRLTEYAHKVHRLSGYELSIARRLMPKYWKQLMVIAKAKQEYKQSITEYERNVEEQQAKTWFKAINKEICECYMNGSACRYGICDECILHASYQMKMEGI